jgi:uncharacterized protein
MALVSRRPYSIAAEAGKAAPRRSKAREAGDGFAHLMPDFRIHLIVAKRASIVGESSLTHAPLAFLRGRCQPGIGMNSLTHDTWSSTTTVLGLGRAAFVADPMGALYWREERLLAVADLHLEKGSAYAARRVFLPPYDTATTLAALGVLITRYAPRTVLALGDSFHDIGGGARLASQDRAALLRLQNGRDWVWIAGNHDPVLPADLGGARASEIVIGGISFRHKPETRIGEPEIAGHLHPTARVVGSGGSVRRRCFVNDAIRCVLPAFGAYAGGLNLRDGAFAALFQRSDGVFAHVLGRDRVYRVAHAQCLPD